MTFPGGQVAVQPLVFNRVMDLVPVSGRQVAQQADNGLVVLLTGARGELTNEALIGKLTRSLTQEGGARALYPGSACVGDPEDGIRQNAFNRIDPTVLIAAGVPVRSAR